MLQHLVLLTSIMHFLLVFNLNIALLQPLRMAPFSSWPYYSRWLYDRLWIMLLEQFEATAQGQGSSVHFCSASHIIAHREIRTRCKHAPDVTPRCSDSERNGWLLVVPQTSVVFAAKWRMMLIPPWTGAALISANLTHIIANLTARVEARKCSLTRSVSPELLPSNINNLGRVEIFWFQG